MQLTLLPHIFINTFYLMCSLKPGLQAARGVTEPKPKLLPMSREVPADPKAHLPMPEQLVLLILAHKSDARTQQVLVSVCLDDLLFCGA